MLKQECYAAIRRNTNEGYEWIDIKTLSGIQEMVKIDAHDTDKAIPLWASINPFVRVAKVRIEVIEDET